MDVLVGVSYRLICWTKQVLWSNLIWRTGITRLELELLWVAYKVNYPDYVDTLNTNTKNKNEKYKNYVKQNDW